MYTLCILPNSAIKYLCYRTDYAELGQISSKLDFVLNPRNFARGGHPWDKWVASFTVSHTITFDSVKQFKFDYPELLI